VSEQCFTSPPTQYRLYGTGQKTQPTVSKYRTEGRSTKEKESNEQQLNAHIHRQ